MPTTADGPPTWALAIVITVALAGLAWSGLLLLVAVRRRRAAGIPTRVALQRPSPRPSLVHVVGGANVPTKTLRLNATWPLATFDWDGQHVLLSVSPKWAGGIPLYATRDQLTSVYAIKTLLGFGGVAFVLYDGREWYLWTLQSEAILTTLAQAGFPVSFRRRRPAKVWAFFPEP